MSRETMTVVGMRVLSFVAVAAAVWVAWLSTEEYHQWTVLLESVVALVLVGASWALWKGSE